MSKLTVNWILLIAAAVVALFFVLLYVLVRIAAPAVRSRTERHPRVFRTLIMGTDNRTSTSKTMMLMWTVLVVWGIVALLIAGELIQIHTCAIGPLSGQAEACAAAVAGGRIGLMQVGWHELLTGGIAGGYLVLLGIPGVAALTAKGITQTKDQNGDVPKTMAEDPQGRAGSQVSARLAQLFSADDGTTDLGDTQYLLFNLVLAGYFVIHLGHPDGAGLPPLPDALLGLTGVSAALYVGKKAVARSTPIIKSVVPSKLVADERFAVIGTNLTWDPPLAEGAGLPKGTMMPMVKVGDLAATDVQVDRVMPDRLTALPPDGLNAGEDYTLTVINVWGVETATGYTVHGDARQSRGRRLRR